jgi:hypothetical protein
MRYLLATKLWQENNMAKNKMVGTYLRLPTELRERIKKQSQKEGRTEAEFIRRVLDRYLLEQEFRGGSESSDKAVAAQESIDKNRKLHELLRNS